MKTSQRLEIRQGQSLVLTPQLQQSLKILQLSTLDLNAYIADELEKNPLLISDEEERIVPDKPEPEKTEDSLADATANSAADSGEANPFDDGGKEPEVDMENVWSEESGPKAGESDYYNFGGGQKTYSDKEYDIFENSVSEVKTLREHILEQINLDLASPPEKIIALHLVDMLDEAGYISTDFSKLAETLACPLAQIEKVLLDLQKCDPAGIFARNLAECLELQLKDKNRFDPAMQSLVANLDLLAKNETAKLQKICGISAEDLVEMVQEIKALNPKPASSFAQEMVQAVQPDVLVKKGGADKWRVELNSDLLPKLLVNKKYYSEISKKTGDLVQKKYLSDQLSTANWLIKTLNNRAETILKVATELVAMQNGFFSAGIMHLKPLTMREIAEKIGMHESTVSRVVSNKFIQTQFGLYELKYFFTSSLHNLESPATEENFSSQTVKHLIKQMLEAEKNEIYSDDKVTELLRAKGINIARRTVAKYREELKIPTSGMRRRKKSLGGQL